MGKPFVASVCVVCMLCAIHTHCTAHHNLAGSIPQVNHNLTKTNWVNSEQLGRGLNPHMDLKQLKNQAKPHLSNEYHVHNRSRTEIQPKESQSELLINSYGTEERVLNDTALDERLRSSRQTKLSLDSEEFYIQKVFEKFGDGKTISFEGFEHMLKSLKLEDLINLKSKSANVEIISNGTKPGRCLKSQAIFNSFISPSLTNDSNSSLDESAFYRLCPSLLYQLTSATEQELNEGCILAPEEQQVKLGLQKAEDAKEELNQGQVWLYATLSIILISLCGLLGVAVIPVMKHMFYQQMLQFFVALAVGTLCGDALLHLLPHAMAPSGHSHDHSPSEDLHDHHHAIPNEHHPDHDANMWKGLVAALGVVFLFFTEKCLALVSEWRQRHQRKRKVPPRVRVMRDTDNLGNSTVGEKLCKHKYSSYPYCYDEITTEMTDDNHHKNHSHEHSKNHSHEHKKNQSEHNHNTTVAIPQPAIPADSIGTGNGDGHSNHSTADNGVRFKPHDHGDEGVVPTSCQSHGSHEGDMSLQESYTVILREHENTHHGHSHTHGHVHSPPENMSAVAWMVVMGDGLHNFTDGMAIGAAFSSNLAGGFSTAIAVFCHELPHELGDFAVLLKAGMSAKQAVFYNVLSSVLCFVGMVIGVNAGNWESATQWIFAAAAGMFLYIALVDMIPELTSSHSKEGGSLVQCFLQILGLLSGLGIMFTIAMYEEDLKNVFTDRN